MKRTAMILLAALALLLASCASGDSSTETGEGLASGAVDSDDGDSTGNSSDGESDGEDSNGEDSTGEDSTGDDGPSDGADQAGVASAAGTLRSAVLGRTLDQTNAMTAAEFEGVINIVGQPGSEMPGEFTLSFSGAFDEAANASRVTMDFGDLFAAAAAADPEATEGMGELFASMFEDPMEMITVGETSWVKWGLLAMFGVEDKWLEGDATDESLAAGFGIGGGSDSPTSLLEELADSDAVVEVVGQEDIRGVTTTHHRAELDVSTLAETMSPEERDEFEVAVGASTDGTYVLDLWIDDDDLLHRFELTIDDLAVTGEDELASLSMTYDIWNHGADQDIAPPPADQVVTEEELGFSLEDLGGLGG